MRKKANQTAIEKSLEMQNHLLKEDETVQRFMEGSLRFIKWSEYVNTKEDKE